MEQIPLKILESLLFSKLPTIKFQDPLFPVMDSSFKEDKFQDPKFFDFKWGEWLDEFRTALGDLVYESEDLTNKRVSGGHGQHN